MTYPYKPLPPTAYGNAECQMILVEHINALGNKKYKRVISAMFSDFNWWFSRIKDFPENQQLYFRELVYKDFKRRIVGLRLPKKLEEGMLNVLATYYRPLYREQLGIRHKQFNP